MPCYGERRRPPSLRKSLSIFEDKMTFVYRGATLLSRALSPSLAMMAILTVLVGKMTPVTLSLVRGAAPAIIFRWESSSCDILQIADLTIANTILKRSSSVASKGALSVALVQFRHAGMSVPLEKNGFRLDSL